MRKHKSVVAILLAVMMIFTFMPTMAFANQTWDDPVEGASASDGWLVKPANCGEFGVKQIKSKVEKYGVKSTDYKTYPAKKHHDPEKKLMTPTAFVEQLMAQGFFKGSDAAKEAASLAKLLSGYYCQLMVYVCSDCGVICTVNGADLTTNNYMDAASLNECIVHKAAKDITCITAPVCENCGAAIASTAMTEHNNYRSGNGFTVSDPITKLHGSDTVNNVSKVEYTHDKCGTVAATVYTETGSVTHDYGTSVDGVTKGQTSGYDKYIWIGEKAYAPNATFTDADGKTYGYLVCNTCGKPLCAQTEGGVNWAVGDQVVKRIPFVGVTYGNNNQNVDDSLFAAMVVTTATHTHDWKSVKVEASCLNPEMSFDICTICNEVRNETTKSNSQLFHNYVEKSLTKADCLNDGITVMKCSTCGGEVLVSDVTTSLATNNVTRNDKTKKVYFIYQNGQINPQTSAKENKYIEIAEYKGNDGKGASGHNFGTFEEYAKEACTHGVFQAKKCKVCGAIDVGTMTQTGKAIGHTIETVVVPPTCGDKGFSYKYCSTCQKYFGKDVVTGDKVAVGSDNIVEPFAYTNPVVKIGAACQYEWKTLEAATPFKLGTRAKVCTVCGDELAATKESVPKTAVAKPGVKVYKGKKKATVTVKAATDAVKYQILVNGKVSKTVKKAGKFTVKKGLKVGKKNTFQIKAFDANDNTAVSAKVTKTIKKK